MQIITFLFIVASLQKTESNAAKLELSQHGRSLSFEKGEEIMYENALKLFNKFPAPIKFEIEKLEQLENENKIESLKNGRTPFAIFFVDESSIKNVSADSETYFKIFISTSKEEAKQLDTPMPGIFAFNTKNKMIFRLKVNNNYLSALKTAKLPLIETMNSENYKMYEETENETFYFLVPKREVSKIKKDFYEFAKSIRNEQQIAIMEFDENKTNLKTLNLVKEDLPAMFIIHDKRKYVLKSTDLEKVKEFISNFYKNLLQPVIISGVEPNDNDKRNVKIIVANKAANYFNNDSKDRLFVFHASWCSHCKTLSPIIEKLGESAAKFNDKLIIGTIELTENDIYDFTVTGFPTIYLMPANTDKKIIFENRKRDFEGISQFIEELGTYKVKLVEKVVLEEPILEEKEERVIHKMDPVMEEIAKEL